MRKVLEQVNMPLAGVALGVAALGNIPGLNLPPLRLLCAAIAAALLMLLLAKTLLLPRAMRQALQDPVAASVAPTAAMALMLLAAYMQPLSAVAAVGMWWCGVALHLALMLNYTQLVLKQRRPELLHASTFIVYVGIAAAAVSSALVSTGPLKVELPGQILALWGLVCFIALLPLLLYRYLKYPVPPPVRPLFCIFAAPAALCLVALINSAPFLSLLLLRQLLWLSWLLYIPALVNAIICLHGPFYPSFAALTFPFVISATATLRAVWMAGLPLIFYRIGQLQAAIAVVLVTYVLLRSLWALKPQ